MRILVIDDYLNVELALRGILDGHIVTGVRDPAALPRMLAHEEPFEAAIVDLRYVQSAARGRAGPPPANRLGFGPVRAVFVASSMPAWQRAWTSGRHDHGDSTGRRRR